MGRYIRTLIYTAAVTTVVLLGIQARAEAGGVQIAVLTSQDAAPYQEVLAGFRQYLEQHAGNVTLTVHPLQGNADRASQELQQIKQEHVQLLFTLGSLATQAAVRSGSELPLLASLILNADDLKQAKNATGVGLEFPADTQLQWVRKLLPTQLTIGVLFNASENEQKIEAAAQVAQKLGLKLMAREVAAPQELPEAMNSLSNQADVLWGITDQIVLSPQTAEPILLFSFRNRIPFVGLSTSWVKAGALYALDRDYTDLGAQCGEIAQRVLQGTPAGTVPFATPRKILYSLNLKTASYMKIDVPQALVEGASQVFR
jgi:putative ABC transport system substrate-binding protein